MSLQALIAADAAIILAQTEAGETVTYKPKGGTPVSVGAVVQRGGVSGRGSDAGRTLEWKLVVQVNTADIPPANIVLNGDKITVALRYGGTAVDHTIASIIKHDAASVVLGLTT